MKNFNFYVFITLFLVTTFSATAVTRSVVGIPAWQDVVVNLGGEFILPRNGMPCAWYEEDRQTICYRTTENWYGEDAVPAFVFEDNQCTPLYEECPESF